MSLWYSLVPIFLFLLSLLSLYVIFHCFNLKHQLLFHKEKGRKNGLIIISSCTIICDLEVKLAKHVLYIVDGLMLDFNAEVLFSCFDVSRRLWFMLRFP